jgi:hypothetical protein
MKTNPSDNSSNIKNPNIGSQGTNRSYDQAQGNRGKQLNPNQHLVQSNDELDEGDVFWHDGMDD